MKSYLKLEEKLKEHLVNWNLEILEILNEKTKLKTILNKKEDERIHQVIVNDMGKKSASLKYKIDRDEQCCNLKHNQYTDVTMVEN